MCVMAPRKTLWTEEEDSKLRLMVARYGSKNWTRIASMLPSKVGKQCRRRWQNHLNAQLKTYVWTAEEDRTLLEGHRVLGNKWTEIARMVTGRTDNAVKNRFFALTKKGLNGEELSGDKKGCLEGELSGDGASGNDSGAETSQQDETRGNSSTSSSQTKNSVGELCGSPRRIDTSSPRLPRTPRVPTTPNPKATKPSPCVGHSNGNGQAGKRERDGGFKLARPATQAVSGGGAAAGGQAVAASEADAEALSTLQEALLKVRESAVGDNVAEIVSTSAARRDEEKAPLKRARRGGGAGGQTVGMHATPPAPLLIPSPNHTSPAPPTFEEASLLKNFADGPLDDDAPAAPAPTPASTTAAHVTPPPTKRAPTLDEIRLEFEELLVTASCIDGGSAFVASAVSTAKLALASCRGAGLPAVPAPEGYSKSLAVAFHAAKMGALPGTPAGLSNVPAPVLTATATMATQA